MFKGLLTLGSTSAVAVLGTVLSSLPAGAVYAPLDLSFTTPLSAPTTVISNRAYTGGTFSLDYLGFTGTPASGRPSGQVNGDLGAGLTAGTGNMQFRLTFTPDTANGYTAPLVRLMAPADGGTLSDAFDSWTATASGGNWTVTNPVAPSGLQLTSVSNSGPTVGWSYNGTPGVSYTATTGIWTVDSTTGLTTLDLTYASAFTTGAVNANEIGIKVDAVPEPLTMLGVGTAAGFGAFFKRQLAKKQKNEKAS